MNSDPATLGSHTPTSKASKPINLKVVWDTPLPGGNVKGKLTWTNVATDHTGNRVESSIDNGATPWKVHGNEPKDATEKEIGGFPQDADVLLRVTAIKTP